MGSRCGARRERSDAKSEVEGPRVLVGVRVSFSMVTRSPKSDSDETSVLNWEVSSSEAAGC